MKGKSNETNSCKRMDETMFIDKVTKLVLEFANNHLHSLYLIGSFLSRELTETSDIDFIGIMDASFDFTREINLNSMLNSKVFTRHPIDVGLMNYEAFLGGEPRGSILKYVTIPVLLNFLKQAKLVYGEHLDFDAFPIKPALPHEELRYHIRVFHRNKDAFRTKDKIGVDFTFKGFVRQVFYMAALELQLIHKLKRLTMYSEVVHAFRSNPNHLVHFSYKLRSQKHVTVKEKHQWLDKAKEYIQQLENLSH